MKTSKGKLQLLLVRTHPLLAKLAFQPYRIKNYRCLAPNLLGDEHIGRWQLKHVVMMMATKMSLGLDMCSSNLDTLSPIKLFQKVEITGKNVEQKNILLKKHHPFDNSLKLPHGTN